MLTLNLELPESWLVEPVMALHDLDNLRLADIQEQVGGSARACVGQGRGVVLMESYGRGPLLVPRVMLVWLLENVTSAGVVAGS